MERRTRDWIRLVCTVFGVTLLVQGAQAQQPAQPTPQERVAMLKQWLQTSQAQLRAYEWIETIVVAKDGEEKSRSQNTCYYGVDGKLQKVPVGASGSEDDSGGRRRGLRGRIAEHKKEELTEYMKSAVALVHSYVPPDTGRMQQCVNTGKLSLNPIQPGRVVRLDFHDYLKAGDIVGITMELPTNRLLGMKVTSYLDSPEDAVVLNVEMGVLPDETIYTSRTTLDAKAKGMTVTVENSGYRPTGG
jgi:hypothetical protein